MATPNIWTPENSALVVRQVIEAMKGTSTTSTSITGGNKTFATQPDKFFNVGSWVLLVYIPNTANWMTGQVVSYDVITGELVVNVLFGQYTIGTPLAQWQITVSGSQAPATWSGGTVTNAATFNAAATFNGDVSLVGDLVVDPSATVTLGAHPVSAMQAATKQYVDGGASIPTGAYMDFAIGTSVPAGFLACNGQAVSRTTYAALFAYLGIVYGAGDGVTTFNVPNCARQVLVGSGGTGTAVLGNVVSNSGGSETHQLTGSEMPAHTHLQLENGNANVAAGGNSIVISSINETRVTGSTGSNAPHNNMQPSRVVLRCIKT